MRLIHRERIEARIIADFARSPSREIRLVVV